MGLYSVYIAIFIMASVHVSAFYVYQSIISQLFISISFLPSFFSPEEGCLTEILMGVDCFRYLVLSSEFLCEIQLGAQFL